jgi:hypothetical protein
MTAKRGALLLEDRVERNYRTEAPQPALVVNVAARARGTRARCCATASAVSTVSRNLIERRTADLFQSRGIGILRSEIGSRPSARRPLGP